MKLRNHILLGRFHTAHVTCYKMCSPVYLFKIPVDIVFAIFVNKHKLKAKKNPIAAETECSEAENNNCTDNSYCYVYNEKANCKCFKGYQNVNESCEGKQWRKQISIVIFLFLPFKSAKLLDISILIGSNYRI